MQPTLSSTEWSKLNVFESQLYDFKHRKNLNEDELKVCEWMSTQVEELKKRKPK